MISERMKQGCNVGVYFCTEKFKTLKQMRKTAKEIIADIDAHLQTSNKKYWSDYYIGITNNIERRLFTEHNVSKINAWWIYRTATNKATAQYVEEYYLAKGMHGDTGGGTEDSVYVYCYEITNTTKE